MPPECLLCVQPMFCIYSANTYLFKVNNGNPRKSTPLSNNKFCCFYCDILLFLLLTLNIFHIVFTISVVDFEQVNVSWVEGKENRNLNFKFTAYRSSHVWSNKAFLKIWKHLRWNLFLLRRCFPINVAKFLRTPTLKNICERLLLSRRPSYKFMATYLTRLKYFEKAFEIAKKDKVKVIN